MIRKFIPNSMLAISLAFIAFNPATSRSAQASKPSAQVKTVSQQQGWIQALHSPDIKLRVKAAHALGDSGALSVIPALVGALSDPSMRVRREVVLALAKFRVQQALDGLIQASTDANPTVRDLAVQGLVGYYTGHRPDAGITGFMARQYQAALRDYQLDPSRVDPGVTIEPQVVSALEGALKDTREIGPAREAARGLGILMARSAAPDLVAAAHSSDTGLALQALNSLAKIGDDSAGPQLVDLLGSHHQTVVQETATTVGILHASAAVAKLKELYASGSTDAIRQSALEGLSYLGDPSCNTIFLKALWNGNKAARIAAAKGLARAGDVQAMPDLQKVMGLEKSASVRVALEFAITALGKNDYLSALVGTLNSALHYDAARNDLIELCGKPGFLSNLYPYLTSHNPTIRERLAYVLMYGGDPSSVRPLEHLSKDRNPAVAAAGIRALRALRARLGLAA